MKNIRERSRCGTNTINVNACYTCTYWIMKKGSDSLPTLVNVLWIELPVYIVYLNHPTCDFVFWRDWLSTLSA